MSRPGVEPDNSRSLTNELYQTNFEEIHTRQHNGKALSACFISETGDRILIKHERVPQLLSEDLFVRRLRTTSLTAFTLFGYTSYNKPTISLKHFRCDLHSSKYTCITYFELTDRVVYSVRSYDLFLAFAAL
jgi:hypothetical protein